MTFSNLELPVVHPDKVTVDLRPLDIDEIESLRSGWLKSEGSISGDLRVEVSGEQVDRAIDSSGAGRVVKGVDLEEGYLVVGLEAELPGTGIPVGVEGSLVPEGDEIRFEPGRVEVSGSPVTRGLAQGLLQRANFAFPVGESPLGGAFLGLQVHKDLLVLSGHVTLSTG